MEISEYTKDFKKIIVDSLAFNIFHNKDAFREETDGKHISVNLFEDPPHLREITLRLLRIYINHTNTKSVIGFTENDQSLVTFATQVSYLENIPFYNYDLENDAGAFSQFIRPEIVPCSLIIPYSINENHVLEIVERFSQQKVPISQVISMVDENLSKTTFSNKDFDFVSICDWISLKNQITKFKNITNEKMNELLSNFD
ncbi:MAG: hypothetical protein IIC67_11080 [Thaumarchaeota archaeon]|nr:hypothetical protein [Nitrososphaerota archaeon]